MSQNKIEILTKNTSTGVITLNILSVKLLKNTAGNINRLAIHEVGETSAHEYTLSTQNYVAFKVSVEKSGNNDTYFWNLDTNALQSASVEVSYNTSEVTKHPMNFSNSSDVNTIALDWLGTTDARIYLTSTSTTLENATEIGIRLKQKSGDTWVRVAYYFPPSN